MKFCCTFEGSIKVDVAEDDCGAADRGSFAVGAYQRVMLIGGVWMVLETAAPLLPPAVSTWSCSW